MVAEDRSGMTRESGSEARPRPDLSPSTASRGRLILLAALVFLLAFGARLLSWQDTVQEVGKVQTSVTADYQRAGRLILEGGVGSFLDRDAPLSDPDLMGHPPGYKLLWAASFGLFGETNEPVQFFQMACDAAAAALVFLIAAALLPTGVAVVAGLLAAFAPQFTWNSVLLLPDTLAVLPLLGAVYLLVRAQERPGIWMVAGAGVLVGLSCWLRANALLLAPFLCLLMPVLFGRGRRLRFAAALLCGALVVIAPVTLRNAYVFGRFIPLSLGAGQTLLEGIADYDEAGRFGIPATDLGIMKQEAEAHGRPDYAQALFGPDGIRRERERVARAFKVIAENPAWFAGVMVRRAASMLRLERARLIEAHPPVAHALPEEYDGPAEWTGGPVELMSGGEVRSSGARLVPDDEGRALRLTGGAASYADIYASPPVRVREGTDYVFRLPLKLEEGRVLLRVEGQSGSGYVSTVVDVTEGVAPAEQPKRMIQLPFVARAREEVRLIVSGGGPAGAAPSAVLGAAELRALGPASHTWTRWPRLLLRTAQRLFITAVMLPLVLAGAVLLWRAWRRRALLLLLAVPAYYFCVQSAVHTEYRYVLAVHYCLFVVAAVALYRAGLLLGGAWARVRSRAPGGPKPLKARGFWV
jgi:hypothetical protein